MLFQGSFDDNCIKNAMQSLHVQLASMIEDGADVQSQLKFGASKKDQAIAHGCVRPYDIIINCRV